ncbi:hypothetical protein [Cupriavidus sp. a3]|uniref:hypothetical protein n=1 Tax=Cupriavidus sp. a3 TaxID=3242158 RepID=UPI003D9C5E14
MTWPIGTTVSMATRRLNDDVVDLARDSTALKRENAELRQQLDISRQAHAVMTLQLAQLEKLAHELKRAAVTQPNWPLARWVKFGPMAALLASIKDQ